MKRWCRTFVFVLAGLLVVAAQPAYGGLKAHYRSEGDLQDATGRQDRRSLDPKLAPAFAPGRSGNALVIERANAGIETANPPAVDFSRDFTIAPSVNVSCYYAELPFRLKGHVRKSAAPDKHLGLFGFDDVVFSGQRRGSGGRAFAPRISSRPMTATGIWWP